MNNNILTALMQLSALVAQINKTHFHKNAHVLVKSYIEKLLGPKNTRNLIKQFFDFSKQYEETIDTLVIGKNTEPNQQIINNLSKSLDKELTLAERYVLMLSFLELIYLDKIITNEEKEFISLLASKFNIEHDDFDNMCDFIFNSEPHYYKSDNYLLICDNEAHFSEELEGSWIAQNKPNTETHHTIHFKGLKDNIFIHKFEQTGLIILKYNGESLVTLSDIKVEPGKFYILNNFDQLYINNILFNISEIIQTLASEKASIPLILKGKDVILDNCINTDQAIKFSFCEEAGNIVALIGKHKNTSGFIKLISGRTQRNKQDISVNGYNIFNEFHKIQKLIGYVPNYDIFDENISIYQNIYLSCKLSFPKFSKTAIKEKTEQIIETLKLQELQNLIPARNKELLEPVYQFLTNLAIELAHDPWMLFIEASLDKLTIPDYEIILKILRNYALNGKMVFITSSHPNNITFDYCNKLWIIDDQKYLIYNGETRLVFDYFTHNPDNILQIEEKCNNCGAFKPELLNQIINQKTIDEKGEETTKRKIKPYEWYQLYKSKLEPKIKLKDCKKVLPLHDGLIPTLNQQFYNYFQKKLYGLKTNLLNWSHKVGLFFVGTIILSLFFRSDWSSNYMAGNNPNLHIFIIFSIILMLVLGTILAEHENYREYKILSHFIRKNLFYFSFLNGQISWLFLNSAIYSTVYAFVSTSILGIFNYFPKYLLIYFSICVLGNVFGILISNVFHKRKLVYLALLIAIIFNILFNGVTINIKSFPKALSSEQYTPIITEITPVKWAFEALYVEQTIHNAFEKNYYDLDQKIESSIFNANYLIPELQKKLSQIQQKPQSKNNKKLLKTIQTEIKEFEKNSTIFPFEYIDGLTSDTININVIKEAGDYLTYVQIILSDDISKLTQQKRNLELHIIDSVGNDNYKLLKNRYFNSYLFEMASSLNTSTHVKFVNGDIIKSMNPLYLIPTSNFGRAQLFAPIKMFNYFYYSTYWFNLFILWWFAFILFIITLVCYPFTSNRRLN